MRFREGMVARFQQVLRVQTVSRVGEPPDAAVFAELHTLLERLYPAAFGVLEVTMVAEHTILARWPGASSHNSTLLMAHQDVVSPGNGWSVDPFAAEERDGVIIARGAIDNKASLVAILEAVDALAAEEFQPAHDVWLLLGHDEEVGGTGARDAIAELERRSVRPLFTLDEGGAIVDAPLPGVTCRAAMIGVSEKGTAIIRLTADSEGGHASTPSAFPATAILARAIVRVTRAMMPVSVSQTTLRMLESFAPYAAGPMQRMLRAASKIPVVVRQLLVNNHEVRALAATTASVTMMDGGHAPNAVAEHASAIVNARIVQGSTVSETLRVIEQAVRDTRVTVTLEDGSEPSPVSPATGEAWATIADTVTAHFPDVVPIAYDTMAATDARYAHRICDNVYRFTPFLLNAADRARLHARDEQIAVVELERGAGWYRRLLESR